MNATIKVSCQFCHGDGRTTTATGTRNCDHCKGEGVIPFGVLDISALILPTNTFRADQIFEAIDQAEYDKLNGHNKKRCDQLLNCAFVCMSNGSRASMALNSLFAPSSVTRTNLVNL